MKLKRKFKLLIIIIILVILLAFGIYSNMSGSSTINKKVYTEELESTASLHDITQTLTAPGEVKSEKEETLKLNTNYYFLSMCAEENEIIKKGANILKYKNGKFLTAPYDCVITDYYVPKVNSICTDSNYINISSIQDLYMNINIGEEELKQISVGQEVSIIANYDETKVYNGKITKINETGTYSNGRTTFSAVASLKNDSYLKLGMSATCTITIDKKENLLCVPIEAINISDNERYVIIKNENNEEEKRVVETGASDANYVEITSGLSEGEKVYYKTQTVEIEKTEDSETKNPLSSIFGGPRRGGNQR